jgi:hypothetical protein
MRYLPEQNTHNKYDILTYNEIVMDFKNIERQLNLDLRNNIINGKVILNKFRLINENNRKSPAYLDHRYAPFYYHLGKYFQPESFFEIGFSLGLLSGSFLTSCKITKYFFGFNESQENLPLRLGKSNIKLVFNGQADFYLGKSFDQDFLNKANQRKWDLVLIDKESGYDKCLEFFEIGWQNLKDDGLMLVEHTNHNRSVLTALKDFLDSKNRTFLNFETRYGTAMIQK